jgi:hypothetical protein
MRNVLLILFISFTIFQCSNKELDKNSDLIKLGLNGKVESIHEVSFEAQEKFGEIIRGEKKVRFGSNELYTIFNKKGNIIVKKSVSNYEIRDTLKYNKIDQLIEKDRINGNVLQGRDKYKYDDLGNIIRIDSYFGDGSFSNAVEYKYDDFKLLIEKVSYDVKKEKVSNTIYHYLDSALIEETRFNSADSIDNKILYENDSNGNKIVEKQYHDLKLTLLTDYLYKLDNDSVESLIQFKQEGYNGNPLFLSRMFTFKYDDKNRLIQRNQFDRDLSIIITINYQYDQFDNIIRLSYLNENRENYRITEYIYTYDDKNNWTKKIEIKDNIPSYIIDRIITYF